MTNKPRVMVTITEEQHKIIKDLSEKINLSISKTTELIIRNGLEKIKETNKII